MRPKLVFAVFASLNLLALFWFSVFMAPWQAWIDSDHAIPYLITLEPWHLPDFYYWGQMRLGSLYAVFWKAIVSPFYSGSAAFYFGHALLFFNSLGIWMLNLRTWPARLVLAAFLLPWTVPQTYLFVLPGQPYGLACLLFAGFFFVLIHARGKKRAIGMGILAGLLYWLHELAGIGAVLLSLGYLRASKEPPRVLATFFMAWLPWGIFSEVARQWAKRWPVNHHYSLNQPGVFLQEVADFFHQGIPGSVPWLARQLLLWGWVASTLLGGYLLRRRIKEKESSDGEWLGVVCSGVAWFWILVVLDSRWYVLNGHSWRYFAFITPVVFFILVKLAESPARSAGARRGGLAVAWGVLALGLLFPLDPPVFESRGRQARSQDLQRQRELARSLLEDGCRSYVGNYWQGYRLMAMTAGQLAGTALEVTRNPELHRRALNSPNACFSKESTPRLPVFRSCESRAQWWHCR